MLAGEVAADAADGERLVGRAARIGDLEPETAVLARMGHAVPAVEFALASRRLRALSRTVAPWFAGFGAVLAPTLAQPPGAGCARASRFRSRWASACRHR